MSMVSRAARTARLLGVIWPAAAPAIAAAQSHVDEVIVTGTPRDSSAAQLAQSVSVLSAEGLDRARASSLGETLANQLGVSSTFFGAGASRPIIRGLAGARVRTLEDGIDSLDVSTVSNDHAVGIDPLVADQIEIFRGPTTLLYGSGAVGGVINTVTTRIPELAPDDGFVGAFELRGDTVANERSAAVRLDGGGERLAWHVDAFDRAADDYEIPGFAHLEDASEGGQPPGVLQNSALEGDGAAAGLSWLGDRGFFGVAVSQFDTLYGVPGHAHEETVGVDPVRVDLEQTRVDLKGGWSGFEGPIEAVNLRAAQNDYDHLELEGAVAGTLFSNDAYEARLELVHRPFGRFSGAFGVQLTDRRFAAIGEEAFVPPVDTRSHGIFAVEQIDIERWKLSFGGRLERQRHAPSGGRESVSDTAASVSFAAVRALPAGRSLVVNAARAQRLPVAEELYANGPHLASGTIELGDPNLRRETVRHLDLGVREQTESLSWSVTAFLTEYDDFIFLNATGVVDEAQGLPIFAFAQQGARFAGLEAEVFRPLARVGRGELDLRLFADYVRGKLENGERLARMPPRRWGGRLQYHDGAMIVGLEATRYDRQDEVAAYEEPTAGYTLVSADFRWSFAAAHGTQLELFVNGSNLRNADARKHTSFVKEFVPLPGRNYALGVRVRF